MDDEDLNLITLPGDFPTLPIEDFINYHPFACGCDECWYSWDEDEDDE